MGPLLVPQAPTAPKPLSGPTPLRTRTRIRASTARDDSSEDTQQKTTTSKKSSCHNERTKEGYVKKLIGLLPTDDGKLDFDNTIGQTFDTFTSPTNNKYSASASEKSGTNDIIMDFTSTASRKFTGFYHTNDESRLFEILQREGLPTDLDSDQDEESIMKTDVEISDDADAAPKSRRTVAQGIRYAMRAMRRVPSRASSVPAGSRRLSLRSSTPESCDRGSEDKDTEDVFRKMLKCVPKAPDTCVLAGSASRMLRRQKFATV